MPEDTHYTVALVECQNCFTETNDHIVRRGTTVRDSECPGCGCKEVLWSKREAEPGGSMV